MIDYVYVLALLSLAWGFYYACWLRYSKIGFLLQYRMNWMVVTIGCIVNFALATTLSPIVGFVSTWVLFLVFALTAIPFVIFRFFEENRIEEEEDDDEEGYDEADIKIASKHKRLPNKTIDSLKLVRAHTNLAIAHFDLSLTLIKKKDFGGSLVAMARLRHELVRIDLYRDYARRKEYPKGVPLPPEDK